MVYTNVSFVLLVLPLAPLTGGILIDISVLPFSNKLIDGSLIAEMNTPKKELKELLKMSDSMTVNKSVCALSLVLKV